MYRLLRRCMAFFIRPESSSLGQCNVDNNILRVELGYKYETIMLPQKKLSWQKQTTRQLGISPLGVETQEHKKIISMNSRFCFWMFGAMTSLCRKYDCIVQFIVLALVSGHQSIFDYLSSQLCQRVLYINILCKDHLITKTFSHLHATTSGPQVSLLLDFVLVPPAWSLVLGPVAPWLMPLLSGQTPQVAIEPPSAVHCLLVSKLQARRWAWALVELRSHIRPPY